MAFVTSGSPVTAAHFAYLRNKTNEILGDAGVTPSHGYGQALTAPINIVPGTRIDASHWYTLRADIDKIRVHQTGSGFDTATLPSPSASGIISASHANAFDDCLNAVSGAPLTAYVGGMALASGASSTNNVMWGGNGATVLSQTVYYTWSSYNAARYFFNAGGAVRVQMAHPNTSNQVNFSWYNTVNAVGSISIQAFTAQSSQNVGTSYAGFYSSPTSFSTAFNYNYVGSGLAYYGSNAIQVLTAVNDNVLAVKVLLSDSNSGYGDNDVLPGTVINTASFRAVNPVVVEAPAITVSGWTTAA